MTLPEVLLWRELRRRPHGLKFRRQHSSGAYVLDFYCGDARLAIEVDGLSHNHPERASRDAARDARLGEAGIATLRVAARDVLADVGRAAEAIVAYARGRLPQHHPAAFAPPPP